MSFKFLFRREKEYSPFRESFLELLQLPGEDIILSSGYILNVFSTKNEKGNYVDTKFSEDFCKYIENHNIKIICGMIKEGYEGKNLNYYSFLNKIAYLSKFETLFTINAYITKKDNYHAKVAIKLHEGKPIAALVGSSNFTTRTIWISDDKKGLDNFNNEADMYLINNDYDKYKSKHYLKEKLIQNFNSNNIDKYINELLQVLNYDQSYEVVNTIKFNIIKKDWTGAINGIAKEQFKKLGNLIYDILPGLNINIEGRLVEQ